MIIKRHVGKIKGTGAIVLNIDGGDGAGKSTLSERLLKDLKELGYSTHTQHFPRYGTPFGDAIDQLLKCDNDIIKRDPAFMQKLYVADQELYQQELNELKEEHDFILLDRYLNSTLLFGMANGIKFGDIRSWQCNLQKPDYTVLMHINAEEGQRRRAGMELDNFERDTPFQTRINQCILSLPDKYQTNLEDFTGMTIDANKTISDEVYNELLNTVVALIEHRKKSIL